MLSSGLVVILLTGLMTLNYIIFIVLWHGWVVEWERLKNDLDSLEEITVRVGRQAFVIRSETRGDAGKAIQAAGVTLGPVIRPLYGTK